MVTKIDIHLWISIPVIPVPYKRWRERIVEELTKSPIFGDWHIAYADDQWSQQALKETAGYQAMGSTAAPAAFQTTVPNIAKCPAQMKAHRSVQGLDPLCDSMADTHEVRLCHKPQMEVYEFQSSVGIKGNSDGDVREVKGLFKRTQKFEKFMLRYEFLSPSQWMFDRRQKKTAAPTPPQLIKGCVIRSGWPMRKHQIWTKSLSLELGHVTTMVCIAQAQP